MPERPYWDEYFLGIARAVAARADCSRRKAGAVVVDRENRIVSTGYNGSPAGRPGCATDKACPRGLSGVAPGSSYDTGPGSCIAVHAEANALLYGDASRYRGGTLYVFSLRPYQGMDLPHADQEPCDGCFRLCEGAGLAKVVWPNGGALL